MPTNSRLLIFKGLSVVTLGSVLSQVLRFVRNVIVARVLTPEDFGVAATFWITTGFLMSISELGIEKILVQDKQGNEDGFGAVAQLMIVARGLFMALVIFLFASPIASLFEAQDAVWGFRLLAVIPLINSFQHRDIIRLQRQLRFGPYIYSKLVPDVAITILAFPIAKITNDYTAFLYISILYGLVGLITSHLVAERKFRLKWDKKIFIKIFNFGLPLLLNSVLIFAMMQGDRIIIAKAYTKEELGVYSVALSLAMTIPSLAGSVITQVLLPYMAKFQDDRIKLHDRLRTVMSMTSLFATLIAVSSVIAGPFFIIMIYSKKYELAGSVIGWLGIMHSIRLLRQVPTNASISLGNTLNPLLANIFRQFGLIIAIFIAIIGLPIPAIAIAGIGGEILATIAIIMLMYHNLKTPMSVWTAPIILFAVLTTVTTITHILLKTPTEIWPIAAELLIILTLVVICFTLCDINLKNRLLFIIKKVCKKNMVQTL